MKVTMNGITKEVRNAFQLQIQTRYRTNVVKAKKGKGSYTRKSKHKGFDFD